MNESFSLHIPTLFVILGSITFITTFLLIIAALFSEASKELKLWAQGNIFVCLGLLIGGFSALPDFVHAMLSYSFMGFGLGFVYAGLRIFVGKAFSWISIIAIALLGGICPGYYLYIEPSLAGRLLISSFYFGILNLFCAVTLLKPSFVAEKEAIWVAGSGFALMGLALLGRAGFILWQDKINSHIANQKKISMVVLVFDADHFKKINDTYGHLFGDGILRLLADISKDALGTNDLIARFGGEEFILILDSVNKEGSILIAQRLCQIVANANFKIVETEISCSISVGVACTDIANTYELNTLIDFADKALYRAKQEGRNRVCLSEQIMNY